MGSAWTTEAIVNGVELTDAPQVGSRKKVEV